MIGMAIDGESEFVLSDLPILGWIPNGAATVWYRQLSKKRKEI